MEEISFLLLSLPLSIVCSNVIISLDFRGVVLLLLCMSECVLSYLEVQGTSMGCFTDLTLGVEPAFHSNQINLSSFCPISSLYLCRCCCLHKRNAVLLLCTTVLILRCVQRMFVLAAGSRLTCPSFQSSGASTKISSRWKSFRDRIPVVSPTPRRVRGRSQGSSNPRDTSD